DAQRAVEQLPWVESASVGKKWPDVLEVSVVEHVPFAHWGEDRMLSERGRLFPRPAELADARLPHLDGPDARASDVVEVYNESQALFVSLGYRVTHVAMDARGSWSLVLDNGTEVVLGRDDARARLQRFVRVLPQLLVRQARPLERADLRYTNGFTLQWGQPRTSSTSSRALPPALAVRAQPAQASST